MDRDFYSYAEIIFGLREEYIKNQKLLEELKQYFSLISLRGKEVKDFFLTLSYFIGQSIRVDAIEDKNDLKLLHDFFVSGGRKIYKHSNLDIYKREQEIRIHWDSGSYLRARTHSKDKFDGLVNEILNSKIGQGPYYLDEELSPFERFFLNNHEISLNFHIKWLAPKPIDLSLIYLSMYDSIVANTCCKEKEKAMRYFLERKIPIEAIPEYYRGIIDKNIRKYNELILSKGIIINSKLEEENEFAINEKDGNIILTKKL